MALHNLFYYFQQLVERVKNFINVKHFSFFHRNLSLNNIKSWTGNQSQGTHDLEYLDITGTIDWVPDEDILALPKLKELRGVTWCKFCANCTVVNPRNLVNESQRKQKAEECLREFDEMKFLEFGKEDPKRFIKHRYLPECMCVKQSDCEFRHVVMPYFLKRTLLPQTLFYIEYALSPFTILLNLVVIVTILSSRSLRTVPSFILIGHTAVIDFLIGIYSIWVAHVNITNINSVLEEVMWAGKELQPSTGPIFISGQLISVSISLLLTLERYLAVVYCVTPSKRMTAKSAHISLFFAWTMAITFAVMPIFGVGGLHYNIKRACTPLSYDEEFKSGSSLILLASLVLIVLLYLANLPLYVQLFRFVKKSSNQAGVKKELSLARKIAILVLTNFIFFAVPVILILVFSIFAKLDSNPFDFEGDAFQSTVFKISIGQWLPVTCLNINSLLDPFLYAFKHSHFKREIRRRIHRFSRKVYPSWAPSMNLNSVGDTVTNESQTKKMSRIDDQLTANNTKNKTAPVDNGELESQEKGGEFFKTM